MIFQSRIYIHVIPERLTLNLLGLVILSLILLSAPGFAASGNGTCTERLADTGSCLYRTNMGRGSVVTAEGHYFMRTSRGWFEDRSIGDFCSRQGLGSLITKGLSSDVRELSKEAPLNAHRLNSVADLLSEVGHWSDKQVVDLGTGDGRLVFELREMGIDAEGLDLALGNEQLGLPYFYEVDIRKTGLPDAHYDIAISAFNIFHYSQPPEFYDQALSEIYRILKPGGLLIIVGLNNHNSYEALVRYADKLQPMTAFPEKFDGKILDLVIQKL